MAKRILVVDDDGDLRESMEIILTRAGYEVVSAGDSDQAKDKLNSQKIDLVILDVMLRSETEGFHLAYDMRRSQCLKGIPIIMLTCIEDKMQEQLEPETAGDFLPVEVFLRKPFDAAELKAKVAELVK